MGELRQPARPRLAELSLSNLAFCGMVLLLHLCSDTIAAEPRPTLFYRAVFCLWQLCSVAVYGFFFLSGLKACLGRRRPLKEYYLRRLQTVVLPYLVWAVLYYVVRAVLWHGRCSLPDLLAQLALGAAAPHLYFVTALVQFYLLIPLWQAMVDRLSPALVLPLLGVASSLLPGLMTWAWQRWLPDVPVYLDRFFMSYLFVWCAGCYAGAQYERFSAALKKSRWFVWVLFLLLAGPYLWFCYDNHVNLSWYGFLTPLMQFYNAVAICAVLACAQAWQSLMRPWAMQALDRASYQIYLGHMLPLLAAPGLIARLPVSVTPSLHLLLRAAIVLAPTLGLSLLWQALRQRRRG